MSDVRRWEPFTAPLTVRGTEVELSAMRRPGRGRPVLFLHGFGSTKEDYADTQHLPGLADRPLLAYDAPGCGESTVAAPSAVDMSLLVDVAATFMDDHDAGTYDLVGHSMGGLTALLLADRAPARLGAFVDIEGNLAPEDCFLSRQVVTEAHDDPREFLRRFRARAWASAETSSALYAASLTHKVHPGAVRSILTSMVAASDHDHLLEKFLTLGRRTMFVHGQENAHLSYLDHLTTHGVEVAAIPASGHWPMYANPVALWTHLDDFLTRHHDDT